MCKPFVQAAVLNVSVVGHRQLCRRRATVKTRAAIALWNHSIDLLPESWAKTPINYVLFNRIEIVSYIWYRNRDMMIDKKMSDWSILFRRVKFPRSRGWAAWVWWDQLGSRGEIRKIDNGERKRGKLAVRYLWCWNSNHKYLLLLRHRIEMQMGNLKIGRSGTNIITESHRHKSGKMSFNNCVWLRDSWFQSNKKLYSWYRKYFQCWNSSYQFHNNSYICYDLNDIEDFCVIL